MPELDAGWLVLILFLAVGASLVTISLRRFNPAAYGVAAPNPRRPTPRRSPQRPLTDTAGKQPPAPVITPPPSRAWLHTCVDALHLLVVGQTRAGKTVLAHHVATERARRGHLVRVADADARPGTWPGCQVVGGGDDWVGIERILQEVHAEVAQRRTLRARGLRHFPAHTLVLVDASEVLQHCPTARPLLEALLRRGGKLYMQLVVDVQDTQVGTLNLSGASHLLKNFEVRVDVRRDGDRRVARIGPVDHDVPQLVDPEGLADRYLAEHPELATQLAEPSPAQPVAPVAPTWTVEHVRVAAWLAVEPTVSTREIARRLNPGTDGGGSYGVRAKEIRDAVTSVTAVTGTGGTAKNGPIEAVVTA